MKNHEVVFKVSLKGTEISKKFRTQIPADNEIQVYDKAIAFAEKSVKVEILSINEGELVIPEKEESELDLFIHLGRVMERVKQLEFLAKADEKDYKAIVPKIRQFGVDMVWMADEMKKHMVD